MNAEFARTQEEWAEARWLARMNQILGRQQVPFWPPPEEMRRIRARQAATARRRANGALSRWEIARRAGLKSSARYREKVRREEAARHRAWSEEDARQRKIERRAARLGSDAEKKARMRREVAVERFVSAIAQARDAACPELPIVEVLQVLADQTTSAVLAGQASFALRFLPKRLRPL